MRITTVEYKIYKYNELSEEAKEKVKEWYLENFKDSFIFTEICEEDLYNLFGENDLEVQYSLASCQGDGFNIYGKIDVRNIFECLEKHNGGNQLEKFENVLTDKEKKTILNYAEECGKIVLPTNNRYCYSLADYIDIANEWTYDLEYAGYSNINTEVLEKFEKMVRGIFETLCRDYEKQGYEYFYEAEEEELEEMCEIHEWEFLEDGKIFC